MEQKANYHPRAAVVSLTDTCNCRCEYCFSNASPRNSSFETVDQTCKYLLADNDSEEKPSLTFFGGEPLLQYDTIIKPIVEKYCGKIDFSITTNGVLLDEDKVDFFADNNIGVLLSIDGGKTTQSRQRPLANGESSFEQIQKNIPYLLLRMPETTFRATLTRKSIPELYDNMKYAERMGFKHFIFIPNIEEEYTEEDYVLLQEVMDRFAIEFIEQVSRGEAPKMRIENFAKGIELIRSVVENGGGISNTLERCGFCTTSMGVDVNGNIHTCQENNSITTDVPVGSVFAGIDQEALAAFHAKYREDFDKFSYEQYIAAPNKIFVAFLINSVCPKKLYSNESFKIANGWVYYTKAMYNSCLSLYKLYRYAANPFAAEYLGIDLDEEDLFNGC